MLDEEEENPLNSDELGAKGEGLFQSICASGKLICNQATRDRGGWDFIVEFPINHVGPARLDRRDNPMSALFQQKTMWDTNDRIKFRLSSIERLAKDPRPSFVYVLKVSKETLEPTSAILIEMRGAVLGKVLEKLREEEAARRFATNQATMYLYANASGQHLEPTGAALKEAIAKAVGENMTAYAAAKRTEIETVGYEQHARTLNVTFDVQSQDELADVVLGITKATATNIRSKETRFGIVLETPDLPENGEIRIMPEPHDTCDIAIRKNVLGEPAVFQGSVYFAPISSAAYLAARIVTDMFEINIRNERFSYRSNDVGALSPLMTAAKWRNYFLMADALSHVGSTIDIRPGHGPDKQIQHRISTPMTGPDAETIDMGLTVSSMLTTLLKHAGVIEEPQISLEALLNQAGDISSGFAFLSDEPLTPLTFFTQGQLPETIGHQVDGLHVNYVILGAQMLVWNVSATMEREERTDGCEFRSTKLELKELSLMSAGRYEEYIEMLAGEGDAFVMARPLPASPTAEPGEP